MFLSLFLYFYYLQILEGLTFPFPTPSSLAVHAHAHAHAPCRLFPHAPSTISAAEASRSTDAHTHTPPLLDDAGIYDDGDEEEVRPRWR